jgi:hypothetical protein
MKLTFEKTAISMEGTKRYQGENQKNTTVVAETLSEN